MLVYVNWWLISIDGKWEAHEKWYSDRRQQCIDANEMFTIEPIKSFTRKLEIKDIAKRIVYYGTKNIYIQYTQEQEQELNKWIEYYKQKIELDTRVAKYEAQDKWAKYEYKS